MDKILLMPISASGMEVIENSPIERYLALFYDIIERHESFLLWGKDKSKRITNRTSERIFRNNPHLINQQL